jgi:hypothetical protein
MEANDHTQMQPPGPEPALKALDMFVGMWDVTGRTAGADEDDVSGRLAFEWLPGGFFLQQRVELDFAGMKIAALEVIGYDQGTGRFPSTVFSNMFGQPIPYEYDVHGRGFTIRTELGGGATYTGSFSEDGDTASGGWRPDPGLEGPGNVAYDIVGRRVSS